jgi:hypothetical protein
VEVQSSSALFISGGIGHVFSEVPPVVRMSSSIDAITSTFGSNAGITKIIFVGYPSVASWDVIVGSAFAEVTKSMSRRRR